MDGTDTPQQPTTVVDADDLQANLVVEAGDLRAVILEVEKRARRLQKAATDADVNRKDMRPEEWENFSEAYAQGMLAVRDLESARMRIGKFIQYRGDGVSVYDKGDQPEDEERQS